MWAGPPHSPKVIHRAPNEGQGTRTTASRFDRLRLYNSAVVPGYGCSGSFWHYFLTVRARLTSFRPQLGQLVRVTS